MKARMSLNATPIDASMCDALNPIRSMCFNHDMNPPSIRVRDIEIKEGLPVTNARLPQPFIERMAALLGDDFPRFLATYDSPRVSGLRANRVKISPEALRDRLKFLGESVPWAQDGFYYDEGFRPAKHPYYYAGLYYIQEPSAMLPAELLAAQPGERVLDLCAAPGGKSVQLAAQLGREGLLVVNDIHPARAKALLKNIERYGVVNAVVLNAAPEALLESFSGFFDKILIDAPCSGEGMFRKDPEMLKHWSLDAVQKYAKWQSEILDVAPRLLRPQGEIVYSTCTFSPEENEAQVERLLREYPEFSLARSVRLWPHIVRGEGHFAAKLVRRQSASKQGLEGQHHVGFSDVSAEQPLTRFLLSGTTETLLAAFSQQLWEDSEAWKRTLPSGGTVVERDGHILWEPHALPSLRGLKVLRSGWLLGTVDKRGFRPSTAFALGLSQTAVSSVVKRCDLSMNNEEEFYTAIRYLRGETIDVAGRAWEKGWYLITIDGYPLGWAKGSGALLKNEYPPGWRWADGQET
jgi:16S rRNA C967 or C1407 C5-methylase (RsmB/RsmF family)/NOL1/NOP2/fmu family ribosome biogenesis protein